MMQSYIKNVSLRYIFTPKYIGGKIVATKFYDVCCSY